MSDQEALLRQQNEDLRQRVMILEKALSATSVKFTVFDREARYLYVNPPGLADHNLRLEDVVNKSWRELGFPEEVGSAFEAELEQIFNEKAVIRVERPFPTKDGLRIFETVTQPAFDQDGNVVAAVGVHVDITEIKHAEEALHKSHAELEQRSRELAAALDEAEQLRAQAEEANRAKDQFLANMSHELRTPLNAILGYAQLLARDTQLTPAQAEHLKTIKRSGEHLLNLINDVLTMSKIAAGRLTLQEDAFDLHDHLDSLQTMFKMSADDKNLTLRLDVTPDMPRYVCADEGKLRQIMLNLLSNAVKFTHQGGITLRAADQPFSGDQSAHGGVALVFEIEDTGVGIAPDEVDQLFDPFVQTLSGQLSQQGTGLGLSITRQFVELMGGSISLTSTPGQGTCFRVEIPVGIAAEPTTPSFSTCQPHHLTSTPVSPVTADGTPYRLLVVEDNPTNRNLLIELLAPFGFDLCYAEDGAAGVAMWEDVQPDLVWMDMRMPVMDGYEATRQIKARAAALGRPARVIALTAIAFEENRQNILAAGCDEIVYKPFREREIFDVLQRQLGLEFSYETAAPPAAPRDMPLATLRDQAATLPELWAEALYAAIINLDIDRMHVLAEETRPQMPQLADKLGEWIRDFEYDTILTLVSPDS